MLKGVRSYYMHMTMQENVAGKEKHMKRVETAAYKDGSDRCSCCSNLIMAE